MAERAQYSAVMQEVTTLQLTKALQVDESASKPWLESFAIDIFCDALSMEKKSVVEFMADIRCVVDKLKNTTLYVGTNRLDSIVQRFAILCDVPNRTLE
eukprot:12169891-Alexandrium_andersonii.AAC.1